MRKQETNPTINSCCATVTAAPARYSMGSGDARGEPRSPAGIPGLPSRALAPAGRSVPISRNSQRAKNQPSSPFHCPVHRSVSGKPPARKFLFPQPRSPSRKALKMSRSPQRTPTKRSSGAFKNKNPKAEFKQVDLGNLAQNLNRGIHYRNAKRSV